MAQSDGGSIELGSVTAIADGIGGSGGLGGSGQSGGNGGDGVGGLAQAGEYDPYGSGAMLGSATFGQLDLSASGYGGDGGAGPAGAGSGGFGVGGIAEIDARGSLDAMGAVLAAGGFGGGGGNEGLAIGGDALVQAHGDSTMSFSGGVSLDASAVGAAGSAGGSVFVLADPLATADFTDLSLTALGSGGTVWLNWFPVLSWGAIDAQSIVANSGGDIAVGDVNVSGSADLTNGPGAGTVTMNSDGSIFVHGLIDFIDAVPGDSLTLNASNAIEVITDTGGISMTDSSGGLAGALTLNASDIWVASQSIIDQLELDPNFTGRADALRTNTGPVNPDGYVRAGGITVQVGDTFFVQNSGTATICRNYGRRW